VDDDAAFRVEAAKQGFSQNSCPDLLATLGDKTAMCTDPPLQATVQAGCQLTCELCAEFSTTTTTLGPTVAPDVQQAGAAMVLDFTINTYTNYGAETVLAKLQLLHNDPTPFIHRLFNALEATDIAKADIPTKLWGSITTGPAQEVPVKEEPEEESKAFTTSSIVLVALGTAFGGSCAVGLCFVFVWYCATRRNRHAKVAPVVIPDRTVTTVSEGGYRLKKTKIEGETIAPQQKEVEQDCFERCLSRCWNKCCKKKLKKAKAFSQEGSFTPADPSSLTIGSTVKMFGLNQAHYNGLTGTILSGPNDKGRFEVDLIVETLGTEEHQTLSFKPDNMRLIPKAFEEDAKSPDAEEKPKSYRREAPGMRPNDWQTT